MLKRLALAGSLSAKVQRPDYGARIFKGGRITVSADSNGYFLEYKSPEGFGHLAKGWPKGQEEAMQSYLLNLADETRWKVKS
jgi:hypothetical protein